MFLNMAYFLLAICFFDRGLMSSDFSPQMGRQKAAFEIRSQTKNFRVTWLRQHRGFMNNMFCDIHDKIRCIPSSL